MAIRDVVTFGFGSFGTVPYVMRMGFGGNTLVINPGPFRSVAGQFWTPGSESSQLHTPGSVASQNHSPGSEEGQFQ